MGRTLAAAGLALLVLSLAAVSANASCIALPQMEQAIEDASSVFVGEVAALENLRRWATVEVTDVWKGRVDEIVEVRAGPKDEPGQMTVVSSVDRYFRDGKTYLFVPFRGKGAVFRDNACTPTTPYEPSLERFRPISAESASPSESDAGRSDLAGDDGGSDSPVGWWVVGGGLVTISVLRLVYLRKRRST